MNAPETPPSEDRIATARAALARLDEEIRKVYIGQDALVRGLLVGLLAGGNLLLEGSPGLGKTLLVKVLSEALHLSFSRVQFTPDLMPADITGSITLLRGEDGTAELAFRKGPIFAHVVLADEVNRATPKTQSALLEAMQEHAVTVSGERRLLPAPFMVIATQNPIEMEGTYPLPEAQLDRFLLKLLVPFPSFEELLRIGLETTRDSEYGVEAVLSHEEVISLQAISREIVVGPAVADLAARLVLATHPDLPGSPEPIRRYVRYGASPRAMQALLQAGRAHALLAGRAWMATEDLVAMAPAVLRHRVFAGLEAELEGIRTEDLVSAALAAVTRG